MREFRISSTETKNTFSIKIYGQLLQIPTDDPAICRGRVYRMSDAYFPVLFDTKEDAEAYLELYYKYFNYFSKEEIENSTIECINNISEYPKGGILIVNINV